MRWELAVSGVHGTLGRHLGRLIGIVTGIELVACGLFRVKAAVTALDRRIDVTVVIAATRHGNRGGLVAGQYDLSEPAFNGIDALDRPSRSAS
jgi:hypothetical protein